ncbi:ABC transporter ATP-binding protein [Ferdinandcohnia quinoae]|uniref:ABC transporter ATP-binding protein n=1 Tax=Fredinandcohnia quinoae TaxID=2918902 RepID=A0AAW5E7A0_9BACI|nr:ABC transporter ATP-binding protein [Fredinandcohnia sp. SECRCQ15]
MSLTAENITYKQSLSFSIQDLTVNIQPRKVTSIIGPNGSGKSTLLRLMTNLISPNEGYVQFDGKKISTVSTRKLAKMITMLSQSQNNELDLTVRDLISHGRLPHRKWYEKLTVEDQEKIDWAISITNLNHLQNQSLKRLSGGERQRAWIAMAVVQSPKILFLDEPTTYLDISHQLEVMELVRYLNEALNMTIVMVLHDINQAAKYSDHLIVMKDGKTFTAGEPQKVINQDLFKDVFLIEAKIHEEDGVPFFTPLRLIERHI